MSRKPIDNNRSLDFPFPLATTPFETYMLSDHRVDYPMTFIMQLDFSGSLDPRHFESAVTRALTRHPLLRARIVRKFGRWSWAPAQVLQSPCEFVSGPPEPPRGFQPPLDLRREPGIRCRIRNSSNASQVTWEFHHACCDGIGALQFLGDVLSAYDAEVAGLSNPVTWGELDPSQLSARGNPRWRPPPEPISRWQALRGFLRELIRWTMCRPSPLVVRKVVGRQGTRSRTTSPISPTAFAEILTETLSREESRRLRALAKKGQVTVNDWLLRDVFATLADWNLGHGASPSDWIVVTMPTSLRQGSDSRLPAANVVGYAFLSRRLAECTGADDLLDSLAEETKAIRAWGLGMLALDGLAIAKRIPGAMAWMTRRSACQATSVFSNLGDPQRRMGTKLPRENGRIRAGNIVLERVIAAPPIRPGTHAVFLATQSGDELTLCLSYNAHHMTAEEGRMLIQGWTQRLRNALHETSLVGDGVQQVEPQYNSSRNQRGE